MRRGRGAGEGRINRHGPVHALAAQVRPRASRVEVLPTAKLTPIQSPAVRAPWARPARRSRHRGPEPQDVVARRQASHPDRTHRAVIVIEL